jgi:hypothetical protein
MGSSQLVTSGMGTVKSMTETTDLAQELRAISHLVRDDGFPYWADLIYSVAHLYGEAVAARSRREDGAHE